MFLKRKKGFFGSHFSDDFANRIAYYRNPG